MKKIFSILLFIGLYSLGFSQSVDSVNNNKQEVVKDVIFTVTEQKPEFPGGQMALMNFIKANAIYPNELKDKKIKGTVAVEFIIEKDGSITEPKIVKSVHPLFDAEALRVISIMPKWNPGTLRGKAVRVKQIIPISFLYQ